MFIQGTPSDAKPEHYSYGKLMGLEIADILYEMDIVRGSVDDDEVKALSNYQEIKKEIEHEQA